MTFHIKKRTKTEPLIDRKQGFLNKRDAKKQIKKLSDLREELGKLK